ncbi:lipase 1-like [Drosophila eugracilis]|uniref:lipase 1-like n=1 Tax=Drosophila eugracilis TaxID=29029 RepID=UPI0007E80D32|nr:lipase 1-like [Drosophila eugracilis]
MGVLLPKMLRITIVIICVYIDIAKGITSADIIASHNYPVEVHTVVTRDGYILNAFRIPSSKFCRRSGPKPAVLFQHGMTASSDVFLVNGPRDALPFMLADACFDVWLSNSRGTRYSRSHTSLDPSKGEFWHFSWHEIGIEDVAAFIDYILTTTHQRALHYVGHSQGCTTLTVLLSMRPEYNNLVKTAILMAPAVFMAHTATLGQTLLRRYIMRLPDGEFMFHKKFLNDILGATCGLYVVRVFCSTYFMISNGKVSQHLNTSIVPLLTATHPAGISTRQPKHFIQLTDSGKFRMYDFGIIGNMITYRSLSPPDYPLHKVRPLTPVHIFYSDDDFSTSKEDVLNFAARVPQPTMHRIAEKSWHHMDFVHALTVAEVINKPIIEIFNKFDQLKKF